MGFRTNLSIIFICLTYTIIAQDNNRVYIHPLSNSISFTLEGGVTYSQTDFKSNKYDYLGRGLVEYFFYSNNIGTFGLRLHGGLAYLGGKDGIDYEIAGSTNLRELKSAVYHIGGGYSYSLALSPVFLPYIYAGLSYIQFYPRGDNNIRIVLPSGNKFAKDDLNYDGELGIRFLIHDNFSLNLSGMIHYNPGDNLDGVWANNNDDIFYSTNIGISYNFNDARDSDADGIDDSEDYCPNTPPHLNVDEFGCPIDSDNDGIPDQIDVCQETPIGVVVDSNGCPIDMDKDGVADDIDRCLYTPKGIEVNENGCPKDSDEDGIPDILDKCPQTPHGYQVDSLGCPSIIYDSTYNRTIISNFNFADNLIPNPAKEVLGEIAEYINNNPEFKWSIEGHADSISENCDNNYLISVDRAKSVFNYLLDLGVSKNVLSVRGFSHFLPIAENSSAIGRKRNRRVEIIKLR